MNEFTVAVIGAGYWGKNLIRVFFELNVLACISDVDHSLAKGFAENYNVPVKSWSDILQDQTVKAVALAVPAALHAQFAKEALLSGKHVFVEKPISLDMIDGKELCELADKKQKVLMVGHLLHYHPAFIKLKELLKTGELGRLQYIYSNRLNLGKIRKEEDILWSFAPHDISMMLSLVNQQPLEVKATGGYYINNSIADVTTTHLVFANGVKGHIFVSWLHPIKEQKMVVIGDKAMVIFDDTKSWSEKLTIFNHQLEWLDGMPQFNQADGQAVDISPSEPLKNELQHFIYCCINNVKPFTDGYEALGVLKVLQRASEDLRLSLLPVEFIVQQKPVDVVTNMELNNRFNDVYIHESAIVDHEVQLGEGTKIWHYSHILKKTNIGKDCVIGQNVMIGPEVTIGNQCKIQNNVSLYKGVMLADGVFCGPSCVFTNVNNPRAEVERKDEFRITNVKKGVTIGANATIVCGVTLGEYCFIGAGAVVTKDVPAHALVVGNPARQIDWVSHAGERLDANMICPREGRKYRVNNNILEEICDERAYITASECA
jgi:UDP-2-acetamido-3-amino-2,3-dideoxy-glucuronate N-acetyltransferase